MENVEAKHQEEQEVNPNQNWSEAVEDLVTAGDTKGAIALLESTVSKLKTLTPSQTVNLQLASALTELAKLYSSNGFSLKSDDLLSRAYLVRQQGRGANRETEKVKGGNLKENKVSKSDVAGDSIPMDGYLEESSKAPDDSSPCKASSDDDWEAIADRAPNDLLLSECLSGVSNISLEDAMVQTHKRRGRGTFSYKKNELYSDQQSDVSVFDDVEDEDLCINKEQNMEARNFKYGTRHVLVLADFPPSTRTIELEKLFEDFRGRGVVIRWVNDTTALAVFRSPSIATEARNCIRCPFTVRILDDDDILLGSISTKDLEPPRQRPQTSARTAQRMIAQGMGLKLQSTTFGSRELKTQEEARKNRIVTRQKQRDDAWGDD